MGLSLKSNYEKKICFLFLVLTLGKFLEALGSEIGTGSIFFLSFSLSNRVKCINYNRVRNIGHYAEMPLGFQIRVGKQ